MFKNNFAVRGSASLVEAFKTEAISAGWELNPNGRGLLQSLYFNGNREDISLPIGQFWKGDITSEYLSLPHDWDKAIAMLSEKLEDTPEVAEWMYFESLMSYGIFRYLSKDGNTYSTTEGIQAFPDSDKVFFEEHPRGVKNYTSSGYTTKIRKASREEIEKVLIKATKEKGLEDGTYLLPVRPTEPSDKWGPHGNFVETDLEAEGQTALRIGESFYYDDKKDTLITWGYGLAVVYEKGVWAKSLKNLKFGGRVVTIQPGKVFFDHFVGTIAQVIAIHHWHFPDLQIAGYEFKPNEGDEYDADTPVKIGCTTGTLGELKAIIDEYDKIYPNP